MDLRRILELALQAPSGGNFQPWKLVVRGNVIQQWNVPSRSYEPYGTDYVGHGALTESLVLAASRNGCSAGVTLFPDPRREELVAEVELRRPESAYPYAPLAAYLEHRCCNRKPYAVQPLLPAQRAELEAAVGGGGKVRLAWLEDRALMEQAGPSLALNEVLLFENRTLHRVGIRHFRFSRRAHEKLRDGLYLPTLELPLPARVLFRTAMRWWPGVQLLRFLGLHRQVSREVARGSTAAAAFGALVVESVSPPALVEAGRSLMRVWLAVTKAGLWIHPYAGLPTWDVRLQKGERLPFTDEQCKRISEGAARVRELFKITDGFVVLLFRIGSAPPPSARSLRLPFEQVVRIEG